MYEGVTEYFANLFQVNQGLISEEDFYKRMANKISEAKRMNDTMPFTEMSQNVLTEPYKSQYLNVYSKGALIGMCIDIIIREKSNGTRGVLDLMQKLTEKYGPSRPFLDAELFDEVTAMTYPEVGTFLRTHVSGSTPIDYASYFAKMGVGKGKIKKPENVLFLKRTPCITANSNKEIVVRNDTDLSPFMQGIGLKADDIITGIDGKSYTMDAIGPLMDAVQKWKENDSVTLTVTRGGKPLTLNGKVVFSYVENEGYMTLDTSKNQLQTSWLKG
jgi:predicted metalloprotease with PDZ domain